jgi:serine/threonine-protein kinase PknK
LRVVTRSMDPELKAALAAAGMSAVAALERAGRSAGQTYAARLGEARVFVKVAETQLIEAEVSCLSVTASQWAPRLLAAGPVAVERSFIALQWLDGATLESLFCDAKDATDAALSALRACLADVLQGLYDLHTAGFAHGDVKPENILRSERKSEHGPHAATLVDFGFAVPFGSQCRGLTLRYAEAAASDGVSNSAPLGSAAADLFALALTFAEALAPQLRLQRDPTLFQRAARDQLARLAENSEPQRVALASVLLPMLAAPNLRPSARTSIVRLGAVVDRTPEETLRRHYLRVRRAELSADAALDPQISRLSRQWLLEHHKRLAWCSPRAAATQLIGTTILPLRTYQRRRFEALMLDAFPARRDAFAKRLLAPDAPSTPEDTWLAELLAAANGAQARCTARDLPTADGAPETLLTALVQGHASPEMLLRAEVQLPTLSTTARRWLAQVLGERGALERAAFCLAGQEDAKSLTLLADIQRQARDAEAARGTLERLLAREALDAEERTAGQRVLARLRWDAGNYAEARTLAELCEHAEVLALCAYVEGDVSLGMQICERGLQNNAPAAERERLRAVRGMLEHAAGQAAEAVATFARTVDDVAMRGATLLEATYLSSLAAVATDIGQLDSAIHSAERSALMFEAMGMAARSASAHLSAARVLITLGRSEDACSAASASMEQARLGQAARIQLYAELTLCEARLLASANGNIRPPPLQASTVTLWLVAARTQSEDELLRVAAWALRLAERAGETANLIEGALSTIGESIAGLDAKVSACPSVTQWEWWGARYASGAPNAFVELAKLLHAPCPVDIAGPVLGLMLPECRRRADAGLERQVLARLARAASALREGWPKELLAFQTSVEWLHLEALQSFQHQLPQSTDHALVVREFQHLIQSFGARASLRTLLAQVVDSVLLWTGAERGMILLRIGDTLTPRLSRNARAHPLPPAEMRFSLSVSLSALRQGRAVLASNPLETNESDGASLLALGLRSVLAVPLMVRGEVFGVVYVDDRRRAGVFGAEAVSWVELAATTAALAIAHARDQVLMKRSLRSEARARAELAVKVGDQTLALLRAKEELSGARVTRFGYRELVGESPAIRTLLSLVDRVTGSDAPTLLLGESGTGKELIARAIHDNGPRAGKPYVRENVAALPETLLESTLFGHVRGAFTGAVGNAPGLFVLADGGTLFLDEVGEMSLGMQAKLLRVLETGELRAVGDSRVRKIDTRILAATHRDLPALVAEKKFREDLYYRLSVLSVPLPALRDRDGDIPILAKHLAAKHAGKRAVRISAGALACLVAYSWPGNVRQLESEIRRALLLAEGTIEVAHLSEAITKPTERSQGAGGIAPTSDGLDLRIHSERLERDLIGRALTQTGGNQSKAAELLGLSRFGLIKMIRRLGIEKV